MGTAEKTLGLYTAAHDRDSWDAWKLMPTMPKPFFGSTDYGSAVGKAALYERNGERFFYIIKLLGEGDYKIEILSKT